MDTLARPWWTLDKEETGCAGLARICWRAVRCPSSRDFSNHTRVYKLFPSQLPDAHALSIFPKDVITFSTRSFENINFFIFYELHGLEYHNRFGKIAFSVFAIMVTHAEPLATNPEVDGNPSAGSKKRKFHSGSLRGQKKVDKRSIPHYGFFT